MPLKYAKLDSIIKKLASRITIVDSSDVNLSVNSLTGTTIGTDIVLLIAEGIEEKMEMFISMIYETPLRQEHAFLQNIAEKLIISDVYTTYFSTSAESGENGDSYPSMLRNQALSEFQILFAGTGLYVPGLMGTSPSETVQNNENSAQMQNKPVILKNEILKPYVGYDQDMNGTGDSDIFKRNLNQEPSFYTVGDFDEYEEEVVMGVRVKPRHSRYNHAEVDFYSR